MQILNSKSNNTSFSAIIVPEKNVRAKILLGLNNNKLKQLQTNLVEQQANPVDAFITSENNRLKAKISCGYRLKNFKEYYKQIPFFESNIKFLNRIIKRCNEYQKQLNLK